MSRFHTLPVRGVKTAPSDRLPMPRMARLICFLTFTLIFSLALAETGNGGAKKGVTEVTVLDANGKPSDGRRVILEFPALKTPFTNVAITSNTGVALIKHTTEGIAKVYPRHDRPGPR